MTEDFSNHPKSLTENKADKTGQANDNTPRDILIALLRAIDSGEVKPECLVLAYAEPDSTGDYLCRSMIASSNSVLSAGVAAILGQMLAQ